MVELRARRYGGDPVGSHLQLARRSSESGKFQIDFLGEFDLGQDLRKQFGEEGDFHFSVYEKDAIITSVQIPKDSTLDPEKLALFEFTSTLLDDSDRYFLETYPLNGDLEKLAVAYNRELIGEKISLLEQQLTRPAGFRLRSLALAAGYKHFCRPEGGELISLIDIGPGYTSYCFMESDLPVSVGGMESSPPVMESDTIGINGYLADLVATIAFRRMLLFNAGHTAPLSLILLTGTMADLSLAGKISEAMHLRAALPEPKTEQFAPELASLACQYLVSLGLTVDL
ncbi:MAG: hypothetical protein NT002_11690 [candidate division Zixibacteria bacterium]|nr:hypothetical protein [candidate division Zixibacteria bacterium]